VSESRAGIRDGDAVTNLFAVCYGTSTASQRSVLLAKIIQGKQLAADKRFDYHYAFFASVGGVKRFGMVRCRINDRR